MNSIFSYLTLIEDSLKALIMDYDCEKNLREAMEYSLTAGGKRIRPLLMVASQQIAGYKTEEIIPMALAMEMIHTYSLIHDDLPAMDNDDLRRGKPTSHKVFGEAMAILAGDALLNESFNILLKNYKGYTRGLEAILNITESSGAKGMISGQVMDMESEGREIPLDTLKKMHLKKTGALIKASLTAPLILNGVEQEKVEIMEKVGENIGVLFQIQDDILDYTSTTEEMGKTVGKDKRDNKNTYVSILGMDTSRELVTSLYKDTRELIYKFENNEFLMEILEHIYLRKS